MYKLKYFKNLYEIVNFLNENRIKKENIIKIIKIINKKDDFVYKHGLIYYKERV